MRSRRLATISSAVAVLVCGAPALAQTLPESTGSIQLHLPPIQLHMPGKKPAATHHKRNTAPAKTGSPQASAQPQSADPLVPYSSSTLPGVAAASAAAKPAPTRPPRRHLEAATAAPVPSRTERRKAVEEALTAPASTPTASPDVTGFSFDAAAPPKGQPSVRVEPARKESSAAHHTPAAKPVAIRKSANLASLEAPSRQTANKKAPAGAASHANMTKQGEILFPHADTDPQADGAEQLKTLAAALNSAMDTGHGRVEIEAFGGPPGDKSSDSRRLSLRRALAVRQLLIDGGVPSDRIDVKALGGIDDHGNADRVDVFLSGNS